MSSAAVDRCPRCGSSFHCGIGDSGPCPCTRFHLGADLQLRLRERFTGCLCPSCLEALSRDTALERADVGRIEGR